MTSRLAIACLILGAAIVAQGDQLGRWQTYSSAEGKFSALMPPNVQRLVQSVQTEAGPIDVKVYYGVEGTSVYMVTCNPMPAIGNDARAKQFVLESALEGALKNRPEGRIVRSNPLKVGGYQALDAVFEFKTPKGRVASCAWRGVLVKDRLYQALALAPQGSLNPEAVKRLYGSLRIQ
jgi:hypothetical protein